MKRLGGPLSLALALAATTLSGCGRAALLDVAMRSAPRPHATDGHDHVGPLLLLAGDMHTHVLPPDAPSHVTRTLEETAAIAQEEGLDFVVLTPHVPARFYLRPDKRQWVRETQAELRAGIAALRSPVLFVPGMEYTDHVWGHVGLAFADLEAVLEATPLGDAVASPALFFERWRDAGGIATLNHPSVHGIPAAPIRDLRYDLAWRAFTPPGADPRARAAIALPGTEIPPEIAWLTVHAPAIETYNLSIAYLRDQYFLHDESYTTRETLALVDREARARRRRIANVGGSDSHGRWLRATTWVLARERTIPAIRDAILGGRTCVRGPEACGLEIEHDGAWHPVGTSLPTPAPSRASDRSVRVRVGATSHEGATDGRRTTFLVNGVAQTEAALGSVVSLTVPGRCTAIHAVVERSISSAIYVDCPFE